MAPLQKWSPLHFLFPYLFHFFSILPHQFDPHSHQTRFLHPSLSLPPFIRAASGPWPPPLSGVLAAVGECAPGTCVAGPRFAAGSVGPRGGLVPGAWGVGFRSGSLGLGGSRPPGPRWLGARGLRGGCGLGCTGLGRAAVLAVGILGGRWGLGTGSARPSLRPSPYSCPSPRGGVVFLRCCDCFIWPSRAPDPRTGETMSGR